MNPETNKAFIERYLAEVRGENKISAMDTFIADEELKHHIILYESALPGYWIEAQDMIAERDLVSVRGVVHGVHNGPLMDIPPTGKKVTVPLCITYRIANEKIVQHWMLVDMLGLLQQIGAVPV